MSRLLQQAGRNELLSAQGSADWQMHGAGLPHGPRLQIEEPARNLLLDYFRTLMRHRKLVLLLGAAGCLAVVLLHLTTQSVYRTRTSLDIQSLNGDFMNIRTVDPTASAGDTNVQTQIKLLQSDSLMDRVEGRLLAEPHPAFVERSDTLSRLKRMSHLGHSSPIPFQALLDETERGVKVKPLGITRLVEVTCDSWDAAFAARFCNTLTSEFQAEDLESRGSEAKHTSDWLMHQASDIRSKAEESQRALFNATGGNGLMLSQDGGAVGEDALRQIQSELVKAQADRMEKEAQTEVARSATADSTPNVADNPAYAASRLKLADLQGQVAALVPPLTEANPKVIHLRSQIQQLQDSMATQRNDSAHRLQNEFAAAKHREDLLTIAYRAKEGSVSSDLEKGSQVALLRREVDSEQQLYQTLLQRAKEAGFASAMQATTIRVVDAARKPRLAVYPQRITGALAGLIVGSLLGIAIAFFKDRNTAVFRMPGESERFLHLEELGVIPTPPNRARWLKGTEGSDASATALALATAEEHPSLRTARWTERYSLVAEAYRNATISVMLADRHKRSRTYVISSPSSGEGKTTVTSNLGIALSKSKLRVLLVEGDLRRPTLHCTMAVDNTFGLRDALRSDWSFDANSVAALCQPTMFPKLLVLTAGSGDDEPIELLHSDRLADLFHRLGSQFDIILVDTPPMLHMADARILARQADGAILILRAGVTTRGEATAARDLFDHDRVRVVGSVLNDFNPVKEGQADYYSSYYAYQSQVDTGQRIETRA